MDNYTARFDPVRMDGRPATNHAVMIVDQYRKDGTKKNLTDICCLTCCWKVTNIDDNVPLFAEWVAEQHGHIVYAPLTGA